jgi:hypothetical protein
MKKLLLSFALLFCLLNSYGQKAEYIISKDSIIIIKGWYFDTRFAIIDTIYIDKQDPIFDYQNNLDSCNTWISPYYIEDINHPDSIIFKPTKISY